MNRDVANLFQELADLTPAQREIYFREQGVASDVRAQVESLLSFDSGHEHSLTEPVAKWAEQLLQRVAEPQEQSSPGPGPPLRLPDMTTIASLTGVVLDGKYRIERQLGKGGMGAVFQAIHLGTTRTVAVKVIVPQLAGQEEFLLRFQREAEAAGRLRHPNVVNVTDFGFTTVDGRQFAYLVMEFLDGLSLSGFLRKNPTPAPDEILDIVDQIALALDAAHESGIVHRDLKPDNIWLQPNHRGGFNVKVLDFGIAKLRNPVDMGPADVAAKPPVAIATPASASESETLAMASSEAEPGEVIGTYGSVGPVISAAGGSLRFTSANSLETTVGSVLGTPAYMAPEQCQGANVGPGADIYSLSVIVYQMFCGCLPFEAENLRELLKRQIEQVPKPPAERDPGIPKRASAAIMAGLSKDPAARPPSATGFAAQLRAGSDAEMKLLEDSRLVASNHANCFVPLLLACFMPQIPILGAFFTAAKNLPGTPVPAGVMSVALPVVIFAALFFSSQMYKAGSTLLLNDAAAAGHFQRQWLPQFLKLIRSFGPLLITHIRNILDFRPQSFLASQLWPVVWASEGLSGKAALTRSMRLARAEPAAAAALAARQWGILLGTVLFATIMAVMNPGSPARYLRLLMTRPFLVWFAVVYPTALSLLIFRFFGPAFFFLYLSARRCLGEAVDFSLPSASRKKRSRRAASVRPGTIAWLALPLLLAMLLLLLLLNRAIFQDQ